jgi:hypothetical protein
MARAEWLGCYEGIKKQECVVKYNLATLVLYATSRTSIVSSSPCIA